MTTQGDRLREHFPPEQVKQRPGAAIGAHRDTCEGRKCRVTRDSAAHMQFDYVEDETVMGRLDDVLGLGRWQWRVEAVAEGVVRGALLIQWDAGSEWARYEDFGYAGNGLEPLKEASTDAFRRCGRMVGVARYIYAGEVPAEQTHRAPASRPAASHAGEGAPPSSPATDPVPTFDELPAIAEGIFDAAPQEEGRCPEHHEPWKHVPAGTSKTTGHPYGAFWACPERGCRLRPSIAWIAAQEPVA